MRALLVGLVIGALAASCGAERPTGIVLEVRSDLSVPQELNEILVRVRNEKGSMLFENRFPLEGRNAVPLPGRLGLESVDGEKGPIEIEVFGRLGSKPKVLKTVRLALRSGDVRELHVDLNRDCLGILCPRGLTCMAGRCETASFPHQAANDGPPCNCFSLFPICVGANWAYDELRDGVKVSSYKQWSIASFAEVGDSRHDKQATKAFLQVRPSALDFSHKWISSREKGERMLFWEKEDQFTPDLEPRNTTFFVPRKIRINEGLAAPRERPEEERYQQIEYLPGRTEPVVVECLDLWNVIPVEEVRSMPSSNFPERFAKAICHRRLGTVLSVHPPELRAMYGDTEKIFCYVRGVGKVYERSVSPIRAEEVLEHFSNPGKCPSPL